MFSTRGQNHFLSWTTQPWKIIFCSNDCFKSDHRTLWSLLKVRHVMGALIITVLGLCSELLFRLSYHTKSKIWRKIEFSRESNSRPFNQESSALTTRPRFSHWDPLCWQFLVSVAWHITVVSWYTETTSISGHTKSGCRVSEFRSMLRNSELYALIARGRIHKRS